MKRKTPGADETFARIVREHRRAVFAVAYGKLRNAHDAEDVMQDVFVEAFRNVHRLKKPERIRSWLYKAAVYRCNDHMRKSMRREAREQTYASDLSSNPGHDAELETERRNAILGTVNTLPEKYRMLVMLKYFARLSYDEISGMTGLPKTTIDGRLRLAKKKLRDKLGETKKELIERGDL